MRMMRMIVVRQTSRSMGVNKARPPGQPADNLTGQEEEGLQKLYHRRADKAPRDCGNQTCSRRESLAPSPGSALFNSLPPSRAPPDTRTIAGRQRLAARARIASRPGRSQAGVFAISKTIALVALVSLGVILAHLTGRQALADNGLRQRRQPAADRRPVGAGSLDAELPAAGQGPPEPTIATSSAPGVAGGARARAALNADRAFAVNASNAFKVLFQKKPFSKYWTVEQKWDDIFKRFMSVQTTVRQMAAKNVLRDIEYFADVTVSAQCQRDLKFIQHYVGRSKNLRWLMHMVDATGKSEPGMLTGNLAHLGHVVQCVKVRAPSRLSNESFEERYFERQTEVLGERFRGKYCLASIRPVLPDKPRLVSRFSELLNVSKLSNLSYTGEPSRSLKQRARQTAIPRRPLAASNADELTGWLRAQTGSNVITLDELPFESELYEYLIAQRNLMFSLPRFLGVCYPSSCSREDVRASLQKTFDDQHHVVDVEFDCEQEEASAWAWFSMARLMAYVALVGAFAVSLGASLTRYILVDKLRMRRSRLPPGTWAHSSLAALEMLSMDKCAGILFVKTRQATAYVDWTKFENNRSTSIDALRGLLVLLLAYSQLALLGGLPVPFMWAKWADAMFPFYRSLATQPALNAIVWTEAFYLISAYVIGAKLFENFRPRADDAAAAAAAKPLRGARLPDFATYLAKRYVRLIMPLLAFILMNFVWPRLSNGFVMQDQAGKLLAPCDNFGWTNFLLFHNHNAFNETCLWPSHVSATFFQLHLLGYPIILLGCLALRANFSANREPSNSALRRKLLDASLGLLLGALCLVGWLYPAHVARNQQLVVPFLVDYLDFDNYQRVVEWVVTPTYNHLASYALGLALAYLVVKRRAYEELANCRETRDAPAPWSAHLMIRRQESFDSTRTSPVQEFNQSHQLGSAGKLHLFQVKPSPLAVGREASISSPSGSLLADCRQPAPGFSCCDCLKSSLAALAICASLMSSWFWNGLGQPMSGAQTFWHLLLSKCCFDLASAYLFYRHIATRRNANSPWMVTRFLVPIGRMSLTLFYVGWLVIWFDLLSSPYQWHPSHYFVCEKYNEVMFIALVLAMFVYAAFEGTIKRLQYARRLARLAGPAASPIDGCKPPASRGVKPFERFFHPLDRKFDANTYFDGSSIGSPSRAQAIDGSLRRRRRPTDGGQLQRPSDAELSESRLAVSPPAGDKRTKTGLSTTLAAATKTQHLTPADQYKLNAELRANYSFASIGLYESAGATGDLSQLSGEAQPSPASER